MSSKAPCTDEIPTTSSANGHSAWPCDPATSRRGAIRPKFLLSPIAGSTPHVPDEMAPSHGFAGGLFWYHGPGARGCHLGFDFDQLGALRSTSDLVAEFSAS